MHDDAMHDGDAPPDSDAEENMWDSDSEPASAAPGPEPSRPSQARKLHSPAPAPRRSRAGAAKASSNATRTESSAPLPPDPAVALLGILRPVAAAVAQIMHLALMARTDAAPLSVPPADSLLAPLALVFTPQAIAQETASLPPPALVAFAAATLAVKLVAALVLIHQAAPPTAAARRPTPAARTLAQAVDLAVPALALLDMAHERAADPCLRRALVPSAQLAPAALPPLLSLRRGIASWASALGMNPLTPCLCLTAVTPCVCTDDLPTWATEFVTVDDESALETATRWDTLNPDATGQSAPEVKSLRQLLLHAHQLAVARHKALQEAVSAYKQGSQSTVTSVVMNAFLFTAPQPLSLSVSRAPTWDVKYSTRALELCAEFDEDDLEPALIGGDLLTCTQIVECLSNPEDDTIDTHPACRSIAQLFHGPWD
jgi:hypothetical protein